MRLSALVCALVFVACGRQGIDSNAPVIDVQPLALDFGPVPTGLKVSVPVQVRNVGKFKMTLQKATATGDFAGNDAVVEVQPGERVAVDISFAPTLDGQRDGVVHLINDSSNDPDVEIVVTGVGIPRLVCADCSAPPSNYCASSAVLINYDPHGSCVGNKCEYQANTVICGGMCSATTMACVAAMGADAGVVDAGVADAGMDAGVMVVDAGVDAGVADAGAGSPETFTTPGIVMWTVPAGVTSVTVKAWGGGGAGGVQTGATGGGGAYVRGTMAVTPGEVLELQIAEGGHAPGNGAGATSVLRGSLKLVVAAGGGGGGSDGCSGCTANAGGRGGAGGAAVGQAGQNFLAQIAPCCTSATGGQGGTASAGGAGGTAAGTSPNKCTGQSGAAGAGGRASGVNGTCDTAVGASGITQGGGQGNGGGGGGGAGLYGGGGAGFIWTYCSGGGGGGSSYVVSSATAALMTGGSDQAAGNAVEAAGAGAGGADGVGSLANSDGHAGRIVLTH
jgi:Abnormal spindle-like microcephaly-assoc'd, ASPM-SPD-2-Hydin